MNQPQPLRNGSFTRQFDGANTSGIWVRFFMDTVIDPLRTQQMGHDVFKDVERVEYNYPGNPHTKPVFAVTDEHRQCWPDQYAAFKKGSEIALDGTPIDVLPFLRPSMVRELKALDIMTAEQLADLSEHGVQRIAMGGRKMKELAAAYLDDTKATAIVQKAQAENDALRTEMAAMRLELDTAREQMRQMHMAVMDRLNAPNPLATVVPASLDPMARMAPMPAEEASQFDNLPMPQPKRRRTAQAEGAT